MGVNGNEVISVEPIPIDALYQIGLVQADPVYVTQCRMKKFSLEGLSPHPGKENDWQFNGVSSRTIDI